MAGPTPTTALPVEEQLSYRLYGYIRPPHLNNTALQFTFYLISTDDFESPAVPTENPHLAARRRISGASDSPLVNGNGRVDTIVTSRLPSTISSYRGSYCEQ
ncbi:hypothetical protein P3342_002740 [Pyrenophora teres f. teres]|nr:hypothetical protein P3342_002740 [Pyrenophora teres f. teres]